MAIQLIINRELGTAKNENPNQGSFLIEELTELVEEAVLAEFRASPKEVEFGFYGKNVSAK